MQDIEIIKVDQDGKDGIIVTFSDGTDAGYVVEELLELRPIRTKTSGDQALPNQYGSGSFMVGGQKSEE